MPIVFAGAILMFPGMILQWIPYTRMQGWGRFFQYGTGWYMMWYAIMIMLFSYFWVANQFNPIQIADDLQKRAGYIPGIRPGQPTAEYLDRTMTLITFAGALFLSALAVLPMVMANRFGVPYMIAQFFGGTSLLIIVGVGVGVAVIVFMSAILTGMTANMMKRILNSQAHIQMVPADEVARSLRGGVALFGWLETFIGIRVAVPEGKGHADPKLKMFKETDRCL